MNPWSNGAKLLIKHGDKKMKKLDKSANKNSNQKKSVFYLKHYSN
jgi:hypothetical protein